ncbi:MAG TPA: hypothetical protein VGK16_10440 [Candidatus Limnocylindrales bacterium]
MNKHRIGALLAALALTLTFAGTTLANGTIIWTGNGVTDGKYLEDCADGTGMLWILTPGSFSGGTLTIVVDGVAHTYSPGESNGNSDGWRWWIGDYFAPGDIDSASAEYTGSAVDSTKLKVSHACEGTTTSTTSDETTTTSDETSTTSDETSTTSNETSTTSDETSTTTTSDETSTTTTSDETSSTTTTTDEITTTTSNETTPDGSVEELTPPSTDALAQQTSSSTVSTGLLLVLAGILAAALVVIPAAARSRR